MRGDDKSIGTACPRMSGSPPRAWGRRSRQTLLRSSLRFTPTCVGTTVSLHSARTSRTVHPHVRGDDRRPGARSPVHTGSPPRAWGRRPGGQTRRKRNRFTPTCVGTTMVFRGRKSVPPVHPHVRGDDLMLDAVGRVVAGSPPRAWGRRRPPYRLNETTGSPPRAWGRRKRLGEAAKIGRFTPTCVGTTLTKPAWRLGRTRRQGVQVSVQQPLQSTPTDRSPKPNAFPGPIPLANAPRNRSASRTTRRPSKSTP